jgi:hypothetical protein
VNTWKAGQRMDCMRSKSAWVRSLQLGVATSRNGQPVALLSTCVSKPLQLLDSFLARTVKHACRPSYQFVPNRESNARNCLSANSHCTLPFWVAATCTVFADRWRSYLSNQASMCSTNAEALIRCFHNPFQCACTAAITGPTLWNACHWHTKYHKKSAEKNMLFLFSTHRVGAANSRSSAFCTSSSNTETLLPCTEHEYHEYCIRTGPCSSTSHTGLEKPAPAMMHLVSSQQCLHCSWGTYFFLESVFHTKFKLHSRVMAFQERLTIHAAAAKQRGASGAPARPSASRKLVLRVCSSSCSSCCTLQARTVPGGAVSSSHRGHLFIL